MSEQIGRPKTIAATYARFLLRLPQELMDSVRREAEVNERSVSVELQRLIRSGLQQQTSTRSADARPQRT